MVIAVNLCATFNLIWWTSIFTRIRLVVPLSHPSLARRLTICALKRSGCIKNIKVLTQYLYIFHATATFQIVSICISTTTTEDPDQGRHSRKVFCTKIRQRFESRLTVLWWFKKFGLMLRQLQIVQEFPN